MGVLAIQQRLHGWVTRMPLFREALVHVERYHAERTISRGVKLVAVSCAWASVARFFLGRGLEPSVTAGLLVVLAMACTIFMALTRTAAQQRPRLSPAWPPKRARV